MARCLALTVLAWSAAGVPGQLPEQKPGEKPGGKPSDTLLPIQGVAKDGRVVGIDGNGAIRFVAAAGGEPVIYSLRAMRSIRLHERHPAPVPRQGMILLRSGVTIPGVVRQASERQLQITSPLFEGQARFSLTQVQAIRFAKLPAEDEGGFGRYLDHPKEDQDLIYFKTADRIVQRSVLIERFESGNLFYAVRGKTRKLALDNLYGLIMAKDSGFRADPLPRPRVVLALQGGHVLRGRLDGLDARTCKLFTEEQVALAVVRSRITDITVESDRLIFLTDLTPAKVEQTPAFRTKKPWLANRSLLGAGIHIGGRNPRQVDNGLVLTPHTELTYDIGGNFDFFEATLCIDARSTGPAHAVFRIKAGDKVLYESEPVTRQTEPVTVKVPIAKVQQLTIEADFGKNFDFGDHCVFAEARVIKRGT